MVVYKLFTIEILNEWESQGFKTVETHLLEPSNPYKAVVEVRPFKTNERNWMSDSINSAQLIEYALNDSPMVDCVVKEHLLKD